MKNKSGITPTAHYLLVLPDPVEETTAGGIILTPNTVEDERRDTTKGTLIAVGPIGWAEFGTGAAWAEPGDHVLFGRHSGRFIDGADDEQYIILNCEDILAVLSD